MISRRAVFLAPVLPLAMQAVVTSASAASGKLTLALHQNTSAAAGYRKSLEGWARAGIKNVELTNGLLDEFLKTDSLAAAKRVLTDNGLTPVSASCGVNGLWEPSPDRPALLDSLKKRFEQFAELGLPRIYATTGSTRKVAPEDYMTAPEKMREVGEIAQQFRMGINIEFVRNSTFVTTLNTLLKMTREAAHPNLHVLFDCYHFYSGLNKLEDMDGIRMGEIGHAHFQDIPDMPRELLDTTTRIIPGDGVSPLPQILRKLMAKGYAGPMSVELFMPKFQQADPYEMAKEIRQKAEAVMRKAGAM
jgi:2-keto-myo-inositol isomerase